MVDGAMVVVALEAPGGMTDPAVAWVRFQIRSGETAIELRQAGHGWNEIADELHLGTATDARRAAALYLSADLASREAAQATRSSGLILS